MRNLECEGGNRCGSSKSSAVLWFCRGGGDAASRGHRRRSSRQLGRTGGVHGPPPRRHRLPRRARVSRRTGRRVGRPAADGSWCDGLDHAARQLPDLDPSEAVAFHVAAVRELFEEAGVLLARRPGGGYRVARRRSMRSSASAAIAEQSTRAAETLRSIADDESLRIALDALLLFAHWVTPPLPIEGRRFDTRFFMTRVPAGQVPAHDDRETTDGAWVTPRDAIARAATARDRAAAADLDYAARARTPCRPSTARWRGRRRGGCRAAEPSIVEEDGSQGPRHAGRRWARSDPLRAALRAARWRVGTGVRNRTS